MATSLNLPMLCLALLTWGHVTSFSIRHRAERSPDLADALAILQRQRRRLVDDDDYLRPSGGYLDDDEAFTLQDVSDWLNSDTGTGSKTFQGGEDVRPASSSGWIPGLGDFKDFEPRDLGYELSSDVFPTAPVKASPREIEAIFESEVKNDNPARIKKQSPSLSKKTKEEMVNVKGDRTVLPKTSNANHVSKPASRKRASSSKEERVLNSLSKEEVKVLMKAVGKLQQQLVTDDEADDEDDGADNGLTSVLDNVEDDDDEPEQEEAIVVSEPVTQEELQSVFEETDGPITKETKIIFEKGPGEKEPTLVEEQVISEKLPDIAEDVEDGDENDEEELVQKELTEALTNELANELKAERESDREAEVAAAEEAAAVDDALAAAEEAEEIGSRSGEEDVEDRRLLDGDVGVEQFPLDLDLDAQKLATKYLLLNDDKFYGQPDRGLKRRTSKRASGVLVDNDMSDHGHKQPSLLSVGNAARHGGKDRATRIDLAWLSPQLQAFVLKIVSLQDEVDRLKQEARLEDLENDALTDALNEATLGQMEGTVSDAEWSSLQQAIKLEAALQDIKNSKPASMVDNDGDDGDDDDDDDVLKSDDHDVDADVPHALKRGQHWPGKRELDVTDTVDDDVIDDLSDSNFPLTVFREGDDDSAMNNAVDRLMEQSYFLKGRPDDLEEDSSDIASLFLPNPERCPAVQRYSSNCALADIYSVPVDFEARALCNLHEMCYACGKSLGVEQSQCDLVYQTAASSLCKDKEECVAEAEVFLRAMKLRTRYMSHAQPSCRSRCTAEFLGMF